MNMTEVSVILTLLAEWPEWSSMHSSNYECFRKVRYVFPQGGLVNCRLRTFREVRDAMKKERQVCARRRGGEPAVSSTLF